MLKILESMPTGLRKRLRVGENKMACEELKCTMENIKIHNAEAEGFDRGYESAIRDIKKWRNKVYLKIKEML